MSAKELTRVGVLARVKAGTLTVKSAAVLLHLGYRQTKRLLRQYRARGRERPPARECGSAVESSVPREGAEAHPDAGPQEVQRSRRHPVRADAGGRTPGEGRRGARFITTRCAGGCSTRASGAAPGNACRIGPGAPARRTLASSSSSMGVSICWYEDRAPQSCLMTLVDDATSHTLGRLGDQETIWAAVRVLRGWIETSGVPHALYTDWKNVYVRPPNAEEQVTGAAPLTQFGRMCAALDIRIIAANSPQAKGRVERNHGTHQDRLVKKLRRLQIVEAGAANAFLETTYLPEHNTRFAVTPLAADDFHRRAPSRTALDRIFQLEETRVLSNDWVVQYDDAVFSGRPTAPPGAGPEHGPRARKRGWGD